MRTSFLLAAVAAWLASPVVTAQKLSGTELVDALRDGGNVIVMRNARSPEDPPAEGEEAPANLRGEREIDQYGQGQMSALSYAFRELELPVSQTLSSPAYRSIQSAHYFGFGELATVDALADPSEGGDALWLAQRVAEAPADANIVILTHGGLIREAFGPDARNIDTAETLIYRPGDAGAELVARLTVEDWADLAVD